MITIATEKQIISININLLKYKVKKVLKTIFKILIVGCVVCGVYHILGIAGTDEATNISMHEILNHTTKGSFLCCVGYVLNCIKNAYRRLKR